MEKCKSLFLLCLFIILLSGCWDTVNIEDRGFIIGTGIDLVEMKEDKPIYSLTDQLVLAQSFGNTQGSGNSDAFLNLTSKGSSIYKINEQLPSISSKSPYYGHLKVIIISEQVAKTDHLINQLLDRYIRDISLRRGIKAVISKDDAKELLGTNNPEDKVPAIHIDEMLKRSSSETGFPNFLSLGDIEEFHLRERSYILPMMSIKGEDVEQLKSGAVFHGKKKKMVGVLPSKGMQALSFYRGEATGSVIDFTHEDKTFAYKINRIQSKPTLDSSNSSHIKIKVPITLYGSIKETNSEKDFSKREDLELLDDAISKEVESMIQDTIEKAQNEYHADIFRVWEQMETKDYDTWKKIRDDWESGKDYFSNNVTFNIEVKASIYAIGSTKRT